MHTLSKIHVWQQLRIKHVFLCLYKAGLGGSIDEWVMARRVAYFGGQWPRTTTIIKWEMIDNFVFKKSTFSEHTWVNDNIWVLKEGWPPFRNYIYATGYIRRQDLWFISKVWKYCYHTCLVGRDETETAFLSFTNDSHLKNVLTYESYNLYRGVSTV